MVTSEQQKALPPQTDAQKMLLAWLILQKKKTAGVPGLRNTNVDPRKPRRS